MKRILPVLAVLAACLLCTSALADSISFNGTVEAATTVEVYAPIGGTVEKIVTEAGSQVQVGDVIATLKTTKVYATEDGTVTGVFGQPGDSAETVASRYGAVMYVEGNEKYTISASTENAYNDTETKFVHVGETVYLESRSSSSRTGVGIITAVSGTDYTVRISSGTFLLDETCNIFRSSGYENDTRVGRGTVSRTNPTAYTSTGSIVSFAVKDGDTVSRGDLLFETLDGSFDGLYMSGTAITTDQSGMVGQINVNQGSAVQKDSVAAVIYPEGSMRIEAQVAEDDLSYVHVGDKVTIELNWNEDDEVKYDGTVTMVSALATSDQSGSVTYTVYIDFTPDSDTRYGMSAVVSTLDEEESEEEEAEEEPEEAADATGETEGTDDAAEAGSERPDMSNFDPSQAGDFDPSQAGDFDPSQMSGTSEADENANGN